MNDVGKNKQMKKEKMDNSEEKRKMNIDNYYNSYADHDNLPRYRLPGVPSVIKVSENPKLREQT